MIQVTNAGKAELGSLKLDFSHVTKGKVYFYVIDTSKFCYDSNYEVLESRKVAKNKTIRYGGATFDLSSVAGIQNI
jgi:hypothetical protein